MSDNEEQPDEGTRDTSDSGGNIRDVHEKPSDEEIEEIEEERQERLHPDNRPDNVEVDNTDRTFDPERGQFTDSETYDEAEPKFSDPEDPNNPDNKRS